MTKFMDLKPNESASHLKIEVKYNIGGSNCFTYRNEERGYYLSVSPVKRFIRDGVQFESYTAFSGVKYCVHPVSRRSEKAEKIAIEKARGIEAELIEHVCIKNGLELAENGGAAHA